MITPKSFHNLHARVGCVFDTNKDDGSDVIVAEIDPHGFMGTLATRQEVAELFASAPRLIAERDQLRAAILEYQQAPTAMEVAKDREIEYLQEKITRLRAELDRLRSKGGK